MAMVVCLFSFAAGTAMSQAVDNAAAARQAEANTAVATVTSLFTSNPVALVPGTKKPLPSTGGWAVKGMAPSDEMPNACQGGARTCLRVIYRVPQLNLECSWVVTFSSDARTIDNAEIIGIADGIRVSVVAEDDNAAVYTMKKDWQPEEGAPKPSRQPLPVYPPIANVANVQGDVVVQIIVGSDGKVASARVESGPAMLAQTSLDAARQWVFNPQLVGNKPTSFRRNLIFHFQATGLGGVVTIRTN
jgi:TonB family protein